MLDELGLRKETIIVFTNDHGDMIGEHGLFFKMNFFEFSARVPMIVTATELFKPGRVNQNTSLIDLLLTFLEWAGGGKLPTLYSESTGILLTVC